jgi:hypothetical protein
MVPVASLAGSSSRTASANAPYKAIVFGGLLVGILDMLEGVALFWFMRGVRPFRIPQSIAAAVLGEEAFQMGAKSVVLGLLIHFAVAFSVVAVYAMAIHWFPVLDRHPTVSGLVYGLGVFLFMNLVVIQLSALPDNIKQLNPVGIINGLIGHPLLVGLPAAWAVHRYWPRTKSGRTAPA